MGMAAEKSDAPDERLGASSDEIGESATSVAHLGIAALPHLFLGGSTMNVDVVARTVTIESGGHHGA